ncbi:PIG-L deacetylase family protein [Mucilaginibacter sp. CSA2-8R]|uniref:PIG-L deacetylase family protein n=1 Tax=Mucilaginibacter sp. CSA2-8R TaxID=3141542 RepID=UPI00315CDC10
MLQNNWIQQAQPLTHAELKAFGPTLVIAPHADDESLGCGGTIALLRQVGIPVFILLVSDGSMSHPNSKKYPAQKLTQLRDNELLAAAAILDVPASYVHFMHLKDSQVPHQADTGFEEASAAMSNIISGISPQTVLVPWRRDPHPDHRATWQLVKKAMSVSALKCRVLEYLVWLWERADAQDLPLTGEMKTFKVDIASVLEKKHQAIAAHLSQTTLLIDDDPQGFTLSQYMLSHFDHPAEYFLEQLPAS